MNHFQQVNETLQSITRDAHINTFHPNQLKWPKKFDDNELRFLSIMCFDKPGFEQEALIYISKELAMLSEIEKHVSAAMVIILSDLQDHLYDDVNAWDGLNHALSCFAAEEINHANTFYRYVRHLANLDIKLSDNLMDQKIALYQGKQSPWVKLVALCSAAYVGESVITVFEHRSKALDPNRKFHFTELLHAHGLDEARHIQIDHFVFDHLYDKLTDDEKEQMMSLLKQTQDYDRQLAEKFSMLMSQYFDIDYLTNNLAFENQMKLTLTWRELIFNHGKFVKVDEINHPELNAIIQNFSMSSFVHDHNEVLENAN